MAKFRRFSAFALALLMSFCFFAGCSTPPEPDDDDPTVTPTDPSGSEGEGNQPSEPVGEFVYVDATIPAYAEPLTAPEEVIVDRFLPAADAFVQAGTPNTNYGKENYLQVTGGAATRNAFISFDLEGCRVSDVQKAVLSLTLKTASEEFRNGVRTVYVYGVTEDWEEESVTYNSSPAYATLCAELLVPKEAGTVLYADVTEFVKRQEEGNTVGFALVNAVDNADGKNGIQFYSSESGHSPELTLSNYAGAFEPEKIVVPREAVTLFKGARTLLEYSYEPSYVYPVLPRFVSMQPEIATVDEYGRVSGVSEGTTKIRMLYSETVYAEVTVTVIPPQPYAEEIAALNDTYTQYKKSSVSERNANFSSSDRLQLIEKMVSANETEQFARSLVGFDLSSVPVSGFSTAVLKLTAAQSQIASDMTIGVYALSNPIDLGTVTFESYDGYGTQAGEYRVSEPLNDGDTIEIDLTAFLNNNYRSLGSYVIFALEFTSLTGQYNAISLYASSSDHAPVLTLEGADNEKKAAEAAEEIASIGDVTEASWAQIIAAEEERNALTWEQMCLLSNDYDLQYARYCYNLLVTKNNAVTVYGKPDGYMTFVTDDYESRYLVTVNTQQVDTYPCETTYGGNVGVMGTFAYFDFDGTATVEITTDFDFEEVVVRPLSLDAEIETYGRRVKIKLTQPCNVSVEFDGDLSHNLHLFANELESYAFDGEEYAVTKLQAGTHNVDDILQSLVSDRTNVIDFTAGIHTLQNGTLYIPSNTVVYIEGGAIVNGRIHAEYADNIKIVGRGIINGRNLSRNDFGAGVGSYFLRLLQCTNVEIEGIILQDSPHWTFVPIECENVYVNSLKVIGQHRPNNDGMDIVNCRNLTVNNCFVRTIDDGVTIKGKYLGAERGKVENITVQNSVYWNQDAGQSMIVGAESLAESYTNVVFRNNDIIHNLSEAALRGCNIDTAVWKNIIYDDIRIEDDGGITTELMSLTIIDSYYSSDVGRGSIDGVVFNDIYYYGSNANRAVSFTGYDASHTISNVSVNNLNLNGKTITSAANLNYWQNAYVQNVTFSASSYSFAKNVQKSEHYFEAETVFDGIMQSVPNTLFGNNAYAIKDMQKGDSVTVTFQIGQSAHYIPRIGFVKSLSGGVFTVAVDGEDQNVYIDLYSETSTQQEFTLRCMYLTEGEHTITITAYGSHRGNDGLRLGIDYFNVADSSDDMLEAEDMTLTGGKAVVDNNASGGYYVLGESSAENNSLTLYTMNTEARSRSARIRYLTGPDMGIMQVYLNGEIIGEIDAYAQEYVFTETDLGSVDLPEGDITIRLVSADKNARSGGYRMAVDRFKLIPAAKATLFRTPRYGYAAASDGLSVKTSENSLYGYVYTQMSQSNEFIRFSFDLPFAGVYTLTAKMRRGVDQGVFDVYVNGSYERQIDLYSAGTNSGEVVLATQEFSVSANTIEFRSAGKNAASSAMGIGIYDFKFYPYSASEDGSENSVSSTVGFDVSRHALTQFVFEGVSAGSVINVKTYGAAGELAGEYMAITDSDGSFTVSPETLGVTQDGNYTFVCTSYESEDELNLTVRLFGTGDDMSKDSSLWSGPSSVFVNGDVTEFTRGGTLNYSEATAYMEIDAEKTPYLLLDVSAVNGMFALKIGVEGMTEDIVLIGDTSETGVFIIDLRAYVSDAGTYGIKLFSVDGGGTGKVFVNRLAFLQAE